jgi:hypothetical protein
MKRDSFRNEVLVGLVSMDDGKIGLVGQIWPEKAGAEAIVWMDIAEFMLETGRI